MTCENEYSFLCLSSKRDSHWLWILLPASLLVIFLVYIFSRPNYARLSSRTYQLITPAKHVHPQKQQNYAFNQQVTYSTPSTLLFEQYKERTNEKNNRLLPMDNTEYKTTHESNNNLNSSNVMTLSELLPNTLINNSNDTSVNFNAHQWNELRTPVLTNYPDLIDPIEARRIHNQFNPQQKNHPLLPDDILASINKDFDESNPDSVNINLGRIWFFLEYNPYLRQLYLTIIKARNLRSMTNSKPTTFVRAQILPKLNLNFSTDVFEESADPDYMTETTFNINLSEFAHNVLKLTVYQIESDVFYTPIGTVYYPLDHLLIAQRAKGHAVWRNLLPEYGDPSAIGLIQVRATVWYDDQDEYLNIYVHSLRATGIVQQVYHVYVHAVVAIHDFPVIPEEHVESSQIRNIPFTHDKSGPIVALEQSDDTIYDQLFRFIIAKHEFNDMTVVLDVYRRALGDEFFNDILLGRTILVSPEMLEKKLNTEVPVLPTVAKVSEPKREIRRKKKKRKR